MTRADQIRAAIIATVQSLFPVLNLTGIISLTGDDISIVMLCVTNVVTLGFLFLKTPIPVTTTDTTPPTPSG